MNRGIEKGGFLDSSDSTAGIQRRMRGDVMRYVSRDDGQLRFRVAGDCKTRRGRGKIMRRVWI